MAEQAAAVVGTATRPKRQRKRARRRPADGARYPQVVNPDPDCKYMLVFNGQGGEVLEEYRNDGWDVVHYSKDGPRLSVGKTCKPSEPIEYRGHTLMDIHKDDWADIQAEGQAEWDEIDGAIIDRVSPTAKWDPSRNIHTAATRAAVLVKNETKRDKRTKGAEPEERDERDDEDDDG